MRTNNPYISQRNCPKRILSFLLSALVVCSLLSGIAAADAEVACKAGGEQLALEGSALLGTGDETDTAYRTGDIKSFGGEVAGAASQPMGSGKYIIDNKVASTLIDGISLSIDEASDDYYRPEGPDAALVFDFDFKSKDLVANGRPVFAAFGNRSIAYSASQKAFTTGFGLEFSGAEQQIKFSGSDSVYQDFKDGEWYHIRYVVRITDASGNFAGCFDAYVNGVRVVSSGSILTDNLTKIDCMILKDFSSTRKTNTSTVYYDNLRVYKSNAAASMPLNEGLLLSEIRAAETACAAMKNEALKEKYTAAISAAKAAFEAADRTAESLDLAYDALVNWNSVNKQIYTIDSIVFRGAADADGNRQVVDTVVSQGQIYQIHVTKVKEWNAASYS